MCEAVGRPYLILLENGKSQKGYTFNLFKCTIGAHIVPLKIVKWPHLTEHFKLKG